jgi:plastocyanin
MQNKVVALRPVLLSMALLATALVLMARGGPEPAQASHGNVDIEVGNLFFGTTASGAWDGTGDPGTFEETTIHEGDTVTWTPWASFHTVTGCDPNTFWVDCNGDAPIGDSGNQGTGSTWGPITFNSAGEYPYLCTLHPTFMRGKIVVEAAATPTPTVTPTPMATGTPASTPQPTTMGTVAGPAQMPNTGSEPAPGSIPWALAASGLVIMALGAVLLLSNVRTR